MLLYQPLEKRDRQAQCAFLEWEIYSLGSSLPFVVHFFSFFEITSRHALIVCQFNGHYLDRLGLHGAA